MKARKIVIGLTVLLILLAVVAALFWTKREQAVDTAAHRQISLRLLWYPQAQFAGYLVAKEKGFYAKKGLDVSILPAGPDIRSTVTVASGSDEVGIAVSNQVIAARSNGVPLKIIAQMFQDSANRYVLRKENAISSLEDLAGKKVGLWLGGDEAEFVSMMASVGLSLTDLEVIPQGFSVVPFLADQYVLSQVTVYNELLQIYGEGLGPEELQILSPGDFNSAIVSDAVFTTEKLLESDPGILANFLSASFDGWRYAQSNPAETVEIIMKFNAELDPSKQAEQLQVVTGLVWSGPAIESGVGYMAPEYYEIAERVLADSGQIENRVESREVFDDGPWRTATENQ